MNKDIYQIKVVYTDASNRVERKPYRIIQFHKDTNLQQLAQHILKSFGFKMSEPFGFYSDLKNWHKSEHKFELFEEDPKKNTLKNTYIDDFFDIQHEYLLIYDYLEEYRFLIFFEKTVPERNVPYPDVLESMGEMTTPEESSLAFDDEDDEPKYAAKKRTTSLRDDGDDYDEDDFDKLDGVQKFDGDDEEDDLGLDSDEEDDEFGFDEFGESDLEDDYK